MPVTICKALATLAGLAYIAFVIGGVWLVFVKRTLK